MYDPSSENLFTENECGIDSAQHIDDDERLLKYFNCMYEHCVPYEFTKPCETEMFPPHNAFMFARGNLVFMFPDLTDKLELGEVRYCNKDLVIRCFDKDSGIDTWTPKHDYIVERLRDGGWIYTIKTAGTYYMRIVLKAIPYVHRRWITDHTMFEPLKYHDSDKVLESRFATLLSRAVARGFDSGEEYEYILHRASAALHNGLSDAIDDFGPWCKLTSTHPFARPLHTAYSSLMPRDGYLYGVNMRIHGNDSTGIPLSMDSYPDLIEILRKLHMYHNIKHYTKQNKDTVQLRPRYQQAMILDTISDKLLSVPKGYLDVSTCPNAYHQLPLITVMYLWDKILNGQLYKVLKSKTLGIKLP